MSAAPVHKPIVHFVGSIPLPDAETVFRTLAAATGPHLKRLPDGETAIAGRTGFAQDSSLEGTGFEPSVPRDTTNPSSRLWLVPQPKSRSEREPTHEASSPSPAEPTVRILFPPAGSLVRTWLSGTVPKIAGQ